MLSKGTRMDLRLSHEGISRPLSSGALPHLLPARSGARQANMRQRWRETPGHVTIEKHERRGEGKRTL